MEPLGEMAAAKGCTLAWVEQQQGVTSPIIGPRTMEQLEGNLGAADVAFTDEELKQIDQMIRHGEHVAPYYKAGFGPSQYRGF